MNDIPFGHPMIGEEEQRAVAEVLAGPTLVHGPATRRFEELFAERMGASHAVTVSSCTTGMFLTLLAQGIGPGDKVAVPALTHVATAHVVEHCGAEPVFVDVDPVTGNLDVDALAEVAEGGVKAIMVVHFLGLPCHMDRIGAIAEQAGAFVVEDCALAVDAAYGGSKVGTLGLAGCYSFYPTKHMTTLEGGMVVTNDDGLVKAVRQRKAFGYDRSLGQRTKPGIYDVTQLGYNFRMNEVQAAVGVAQLGRLDGFQKARADNFAAIRAALEPIEGLTLIGGSRGRAVSTHYCLNAVLPRDASIERDHVVQFLKERGIGTSVHYPSAVPLFSYYREKYGFQPGCFPVAEWLAEATISLPVGPHLTVKDAATVGNLFREAVEDYRAA